VADAAIERLLQHRARRAIVGRRPLVRSGERRQQHEPRRGARVIERPLAAFGDGHGRVCGSGGADFRERGRNGVPPRFRRPGQCGAMCVLE
jgi:hypothetical protein